MSDSNRIALAYKEESTPGTYAGGTAQAINFSSVNLNAQKNTAEENTIRSDRNLKGLIQTSLVPQGGFGFDLQYGNINPILESQIGSSPSTLVDIAATTCTVTDNSTSWNIAASAGTPFSVMAAGQWIKVTISSTAYMLKVTAINNSGADIDTNYAVSNLPTGSQSCAFKGQYTRNGTTQRFMSLERNDQDLSADNFQMFLGMLPATTNLNFTAEQIVTGDVSFLGMTAQTPTDATGTGGAYTAATTNEGFAALRSRIGAIMLGSTEVGTTIPVLSCQFSLNSNARRDAAINTSEIGWGTMSVTGQVQVYMKGGEAMVDDFYNHTTRSLSVVAGDPNGNYLVITINALKYGNFTKDASGRDQAVIGTFPFTGIFDSSTSSTVQIDWVPA